MGTRGDGILILALAGSLLFGAELPSLHLDPVQGPATVVGRLDAVLRDSLRARPVSLFPLDSLDRLRDRGEWSPGERTASTTAALLATTHRQAIGWARLDPLEERFSRSWLLWADRQWALSGEVFRATSAGTTTRRIRVEMTESLGFVGADDASRYPASSADRSRALESLAGMWAAAAVPFLVGEPAKKP